LRHVRVFGGAGEAAGFGDGAEVAELMKFHGGNSKFLSMTLVLRWPASGSLCRPCSPSLLRVLRRQSF